MDQQTTYRCPTCGAEFATQQQLQQHGQQMHGMAGSKTGSYRCPACNAEFATEEQLQQHGKLAHAQR